MTPFTDIPSPDAHLSLIYQDAWLLAVDKPAGLLSVPGRGADKQDCLSARLQQVFPEAQVVHRLDMATSGLMLFARGAEMQRELSRMFRERLIEKQYVAVVTGRVATETGSVDLPVIADWPNRPRQRVDRTAGKPALTHYRVLHDGDAVTGTRLALQPVTGRTHQLRVHLAALGHPIIGDALYGGCAAERLLLHAERLRFNHPASSETITLHSPAPF
ncbi:MAG: RluA family pseudouridine synthase [Pseudomonadota bacterium]